jgi:hypothetical protein
VKLPRWIRGSVVLVIIALFVAGPSALANGPAHGFCTVPLVGGLPPSGL